MGPKWSADRLLMKTRRQDGFTMLEVMIVLSIGLVLMAMTAPLVNTALNMYRLRGAGGDLVNLLQSARMRAVTSDRYLPISVAPGVPGPAAANTFNAYLDVNGSLSYDPGESAVAFNRSVQIQPPAAAPNPQDLYQKFLPNTPLGQVLINPNNWGPDVTFGPRGLPCQASAAAGGTCSYTTAAPNPPGQPLAFEVFLQNTRTGIWEAVTVNPAGRVRAWHYQATNNAWQPLN